MELNSNDTKGYGHKLQPGKTQLDVQKSSVTVKVETTGAGGAEAVWSVCPWRQ